MSFTVNRIRRVFQKIEGETPDALFIKNSTEPHIDLSFFYFTGLESGVFEDSIFLAYRDGDATLYTTRLEEASAKEGSSRFKTVVFEDKEDRERHLKELGSNLDKIGVNSRELTYSDLLNLKRMLPNVKIIDVSDALSYSRLVKDEEEISCLRRAAEITSRIWKTIPAILKEGVTESEVKAQICYQIQKESSTLAFEPIVSFGTNTAEPHYLGGERRLKVGDFALLDFGARYRRYCADMTRTFVLGPASEEQKRMYSAVSEANARGIESMAAGVVAGEVHHEVADAIASKGFGDKFTHSTGHSIGLSVHDGAKINAASNFILEEGMVFTVEPGIYIPAVGGVRIEDDVVVCKGGCEVLTSGVRELVEL